MTLNKIKMLALIIFLKKFELRHIKNLCYNIFFELRLTSLVKIASYK
jgi:hypothetical protein